MQKPDYKNKSIQPQKKLKALHDLYINAGTRLIKKGEVFTTGCGNCAKNMIANKQAVEVNE